MNSLNPKAGCLAVIFTSILRADAEGYEGVAEQMVDLASRQDGFLGLESFRNESGFGLTVCYWEDDAAVDRFRKHVDHLAAQERGRQDWYSRYTVTVARVERTYTDDDRQQRPD